MTYGDRQCCVGENPAVIFSESSKHRGDCEQGGTGGGQDLSIFFSSLYLLKGSGYKAKLEVYSKTFSLTYWQFEFQPLPHRRWTLKK